MRVTKHREGGGGDGSDGDQGLRKRVRPFKVDEICYLYDSIDGPHGEVCGTSNPRHKIVICVLCVMNWPVPVVSQNHQGVGQTWVQQDSQEPEGEQDWEGQAVDVSCDQVDFGCTTKCGSFRHWPVAIWPPFRTVMKWALLNPKIFISEGGGY